MTVTVRNIITSMRLMSAFDWEDFFESVSMVDEILRNGSNFAEMDFATRDYYRHAIEDLSRGSSHTEIDVARRAIDRAKRARAELHTDGQPSADRKADPGYYLISQGRLDFERELGFQRPLETRFAAPLRACGRSGLSGHHRRLDRHNSGAASHSRATRSASERLIWSCLACSHPFPRRTSPSRSSIAPSRTCLARARCRAWNCATACPPRLRTDRCRPHSAHFDSGRSRNWSSAWKSTTSRIPKAICVSRCFPTGWMRPPNHCRNDEELLSAAIERHRELEQPLTGPHPDGGDRFFLFHRRRVWNERERKWMGWERKRGKLHELNQLLRGATQHHVSSHRRRAAASNPRRSLRHHSRCRHAPAARRGGSLGRHHGAPAEPAEVQRSARPRRGRLWRRAAAHHSLAAQRSRRIAFPENFLRSQRY